MANTARAQNATATIHQIILYLLWATKHRELFNSKELREQHPFVDGDVFELTISSRSTNMLARPRLSTIAYVMR
ncbi:MAG: hypothetical protein CMJ64_00960 [Planctomycetaceae bacterium]|jgi:hypothetical protein|nr:hypothetical protein [Planctomycetaceae bacterium]